MGRTRSRSRRSRSSGSVTRSSMTRRARPSERKQRGIKRRISESSSSVDDRSRSRSGWSSSGYSSDSDSGYDSDISLKSERKYTPNARASNKLKFKTLEHNGPLFPPPYQRLPRNVKLLYRGRPVSLTPAAEEAAGFYAKLLGKPCTEDDVFNDNFFKDFKGKMSPGQSRQIVYLEDCDFRDIQDHFLRETEKKKRTAAREKKARDDRNNRKYHVCRLDGREEPIQNPTLEPPGIFMGRGDNSHRGRVKGRIRPEDIAINCSRGHTPKPPKGTNWAEVRHDRMVTWLARWKDTVLGNYKYIELGGSSGLKGKSDLMKYEKARDLADKITSIRKKYMQDCRSSSQTTRQLAVAMYFIDKLALRAGNEKSSDLADTVGCCSLRQEHLDLFKHGKDWVVAFDFLAKDSIRYKNDVSVPEDVFKSLQSFLAGKHREHEVFDRLDTGILNAHLSSLMEGLTAKVFRTCNASLTLEKELDIRTPWNGTVTEKLLAYTKANREVAILCNHKKAVPKSFEKSMKALEKRIEDKDDKIYEIEEDLERLDKHRDPFRYKQKQKMLKREEKAMKELEAKKVAKEEGKDIALGTSKLNYLDPRIIVAWCEKYGVPIDKVYSAKQREKFDWAIKSPNKHFRF